MKIILATASEEINTFIVENIENAAVIGIASNRRHLLKLAKREPPNNPDVVILSTLLPGEEDLTEILFKTLEYGNCRIILLAKHKDKILQDAFYLGVRDYLFDPINPSVLLSRIYHPMSFKEAAIIVKPRKRSLFFNRKMELFFNKHIPDQSVLSDEARGILQGICKYLEIEPQTTLEDTLFMLEQNLIEKTPATQ